MRKQKEKLRKITFTIVMKRIKYLGTNLPKETKDLYIENYKTLMKESKMTQIDGEYSMFTDRKNQYSENEYTTQGNL